MTASSAAIQGLKYHYMHSLPPIEGRTEAEKLLSADNGRFNSAVNAIIFNAALRAMNHPSQAHEQMQQECYTAFKAGVTALNFNEMSPEYVKLCQTASDIFTIRARIMAGHLQNNTAFVEITSTDKMVFRQKIYEGMLHVFVNQPLESFTPQGIVRQAEVLKEATSEYRNAREECDLLFDDESRREADLCWGIQRVHQHSLDSAIQRCLNPDESSPDFVAAKQAMERKFEVYVRGQSEKPRALKREHIGCLVPTAKDIEKKSEILCDHAVMRDAVEQKIIIDDLDASFCESLDSLRSDFCRTHERFFGPVDETQMREALESNPLPHPRFAELNQSRTNYQTEKMAYENFKRIRETAVQHLDKVIKAYTILKMPKVEFLEFLRTAPQECPPALSIRLHRHFLGEMPRGGNCTVS
jgi:hypothetical protein